jgi:hypothetical protein
MSIVKSNRNISCHVKFIPVALLLVTLVIISCDHHSTREGTLDCEPRVCDTLDSYQLCLYGSDSICCQLLGENIDLNGVGFSALQFKAWRCSPCKGSEIATVRLLNKTSIAGEGTMQEVLIKYNGKEARSEKVTIPIGISGVSVHWRGFKANITRKEGKQGK